MSARIEAENTETIFSRQLGVWAAVAEEIWLTPFRYNPFLTLSEQASPTILKPYFFKWNVPKNATSIIGARSLDTNPAHFNEEAMKKSIFGGKVVQGIGAIDQVFGSMEEHGLAVAEFKVGFASPVYPEDIIDFSVLNDQTEAGRHHFNIDGCNLTHLGKDGKPDSLFNNCEVVAVPKEEARYRKLDDDSGTIIDTLVHRLAGVKVGYFDADARFLKKLSSLAEMDGGLRMAVRTIVTEKMARAMAQCAKGTRPFAELVPTGSVSRLLGSCYPNGTVIYVATSGEFATENRTLKAGDNYTTVVAVDSSETKKRDDEGNPLRKVINCSYSVRRQEDSPSQKERSPLVAQGSALISIAKMK